MKVFWQRLQARERTLVLAAGMVAVLALLWVAVWEPLGQARAQAYRQLAEQQALLDWLERVAPEVRRLRSRSGSESAPESRSTLALIDDSARAAGLAGSMKRIEPAAGDEVRVDFESAPFPDLMEWLAGLVSERPFVVLRLDANRVEVGRVDAAVVLRRVELPAAGG